MRPAGPFNIHVVRLCLGYIYTLMHSLSCRQCLYQSALAAAGQTLTWWCTCLETNVINNYKTVAQFSFQHVPVGYTCKSDLEMAFKVIVHEWVEWKVVYCRRQYSWSSGFQSIAVRRVRTHWWRTSQCTTTTRETCPASVAWYLALRRLCLSLCRFVCVCGSVYLPVWTSIAVCYVQLQPGMKERIFSSLFVLCLSVYMSVCLSVCKQVVTSRANSRVRWLSDWQVHVAEGDWPQSKGVAILSFQSLREAELWKDSVPEIRQQDWLDGVDMIIAPVRSMPRMCSLSLSLSLSLSETL